MIETAGAGKGGRDGRGFEGGCDCRGDPLPACESRPLFVHCCHCRWCQRETGSAFVMNALIEADRVTLLAGEPDIVLTPSASGKGQKHRPLPDLPHRALEHYAGAGERFRFVRVGTLDDPDRFPPEIHIFTALQAALGRSCPPAVPGGARILRPRRYWPAESLARREALLRAPGP